MTISDFKPLYRYSFAESKNLNEQELWRESQNENERCRDFIDQMVRENYDGSYLKVDVAQKTVAEFGYNRTRWVLANHIQVHEFDGRFSCRNKAWASEIFIPRPGKDAMRRDPYLSDHTHSFLLNSHSVLVDHIASGVQKMYTDLNLLDHRHCVPDGGEYIGEVLILRAELLTDEYKKTDSQLFLAESGFGCDPTASGRAVFGQFLIDGEKARFNREDFVGICADEHLPEWATEKLAQNQTSDESQSIGMAMQ